MRRVDRNGTDHRQAWELIPWVVNGRASVEEHELVEGHLRQCEDCSREFEFQRSLQRALAEPLASGLDAAASLQKLSAELDREAVPAAAMPAATAVDRGRHPVRRRAGQLRLWRLRTQGLLAAVVIEAVALAAVGNAWWLQAHEARTAEQSYRVLSSAPPAAPAATGRAVLSPTITAAQLQALLVRANLQIVAGPRDAGVYSLAPRASSDPAARQQALQELRANPDVRFAEPVGDPAK